MQTTNTVVVLYQPQRNVNIGATVRALLNMGLHQLRLIQPHEYDPLQLDALAHRYADQLAPIELHDSLETALADVHTTVGFTARSRSERTTAEWPELAPAIHSLSDSERVALLFGREDWGLPNAALERCTLVAHLPTAPSYPSLNLAAAVLLALYELQRTVPTFAPPAPAQADYNATLAFVDQALEQVHFHRTVGQHNATLRTLRDLLMRAAPTPKELRLLQAFARRVLNGPRQPRSAPAQPPPHNNDDSSST